MSVDGHGKMYLTSENKGVKAHKALGVKMSKKRLEEIRDMVIAMSIAEDRDDKEELNKIMNDLFEKHFDWMYLQAERVQGLESE